MTNLGQLSWPDYWRTDMAESPKRLTAQDIVFRGEQARIRRQSMLWKLACIALLMTGFVLSILYFTGGF